MSITPMTASERVFANADCWNAIMTMKREIELECQENECLYEEYIYKQKCSVLESHDGFYQRDDEDFDELGNMNYNCCSVSAPCQFHSDALEWLITLCETSFDDSSADFLSADEISIWLGS
jgi:hypothetical protein